MPTEAQQALEGLGERDTRFYADALGDDDLGMVVRVHLHIEHELREFVLTAAPQAEHVKFSYLGFDGTCRLALILGLNPDFGPFLRAAGTLRNKFSHRLDTRLGEEEANNLFTACSPTQKDIAHRSFASLKRDHPEKSWPATFAHLSARERIQLLLVSLRAGMIAERLRIMKKTSNSNKAPA